MSKAKLVIIDDEQELLDLLKMTLELENYEIITALDGDIGLKMIEKHQPDLIICDIIMPKVNGYEVLKKVREDTTRWIPFIMLSAIADFGKIKQAHDDDTDFYLTKPVDPLILNKNIKTLLNLVKHRRES